MAKKQRGKRSQDGGGQPPHTSPNPHASSTPENAAPPQGSIPPRSARVVRASPRARRAARVLEVSLEQVVGHGQNGRIREADVFAACFAAAQTIGLPQPTIDPDEWPLAPPSPTQTAWAERFSADSPATRVLEFSLPLSHWQPYCQRRRLRNFPDEPDLLASVPCLQAVSLALTAVPELGRIWWRDAWRQPPEPMFAWRLETPAGAILAVVGPREVGSRRRLRHWAAKTRADARNGRTSPLPPPPLVALEDMTESAVACRLPVLGAHRAATVALGPLGSQAAYLAATLAYDERAATARQAMRFCEQLRQAFATAIS